MTEVETIIIGAGPAGSSAARELLRNDRECLVLDRKTMPRLKLCAGWITPKVLSDLDIGPDEYPHGKIKLEHIKFYFGRRHKRSLKAAAEQYSIRRIEFDNWLLQRSGAKLEEHTVRNISRENGSFVIDGKYRCQNLIGAGGTNCPVKKHFFGQDSGRLIVTQEIEYETTPQSETCMLWFPYAGAFGYAWYVPKVGAVNVGFGGLRAQNVNWDKGGLWTEFVALLKREGCLNEDPPTPKGYSYYLAGRQKKVKADNAYIVGDAAGLATVDLAEGIGPAVESGQMAVRDILGKADYSTNRILKYSLPWTYRIFRNMVSWLP